MKHNVLYISYDGMTDPLGQSQVLPYLVGLSKQGYSFHLISFEKSERFALHREHIQEICDNANITWHPQTYRGKPPVLSTLMDVRDMRKLAYRLHTKYYFDIVHCRSYVAALVGLRMKKRYGTKFVFDMRGFWADERVDGGLWNLKNPLFKSIYTFFKRKEREFLMGADHIVSLTERAKQEIESWKLCGQGELPITVIPCCADLTLFNPERIDPQDQQRVRTQLDLSIENTVLGYVGSIGTWYMLNEMLDYYAVFREHNPQPKFLFVTGEQPHTIQQMAAEKGIDRKEILVTSTTHNLVPLYISLFDLSVFFIRPTYSKMASSPTKQGEIMAMGVPLVCNAGVGDTDEIVRKHKAGAVLQQLDESNYKSNANLPQNFDRLSTMNGARDVYGLDRGVELYRQVYLSVLS